MKMSTAVIIVKGLCYMVIGGLTPLTSGLAQWIEGGVIPQLNWIVIIAGCCVGAATQVLSFLSQSYGNYKAECANGNGAVKP